MSDPTDRSECPQLRPALGDIVDVAGVLPVADTNPCPAKDSKSRELAALRILRRPSLRVRMKHLGEWFLPRRTATVLSQLRERTFNGTSALE